MSYTRRSFLKTGAAVAAVAAMPRSLSALSKHARPAAAAWPITGAEVRALALRAIDAARAAGAAYADARLVHRRSLGLASIGFSDSEELTIGARALVDGYWGFAASTLWEPDEATRLGREAVAQAKANKSGPRRVVDLGAIPVVRDGHWETPVQVDPFTISLEEIYDFWQGTVNFWQDPQRFEHSGVGGTVERLEKVFASTEGSYTTQVLFRASGGVGVSYKGIRVRSDVYSGTAARGWEHFTRIPIEDEIRRALEEAREIALLPIKPVQVGRYDAVFGAGVVAELLNRTIGAATELDRALGYEANASGTSYINDPSGMLGNYQAAAPLITIRGNRSMPAGLATVKWDDEGVVPEDFALVEDGVLVDFQTTRESAAWLEEYYAKLRRPIRSHGCANAESALMPPLISPPNLQLVPAVAESSFQELISDVERGIAIRDAVLDVDFQCLNGLGTPPPPDIPPQSFFEVKNGKRIARIAGPAFLFRTPELWKSVLALGGPASLRRSGMSRTKGEPAQSASFTVEAPPMAVKQVTFIDPTRKA